MQLTEIAKSVGHKRLLLRENNQVVETFDQMLDRVSSSVAAADALYGATPEMVRDTASRFRSMIDSQDFMPNSPTFTGAGTKLGQLSACFVLPISDSLGEWGVDSDTILDSMKAGALIHRTGGGTGFSFSRLREEGAVVHRTGRESSGPIMFLQTYNAVTEVIKQGGTRRGANMGILRVDHPDIIKYIHCKDDTSKVTNFNISVGTTYTFERAYLQGRQALEKQGTWDSLFHNDSLTPEMLTDMIGHVDYYHIISPQTGQTLRHEHALYVYWHMIRAAWATGEPGIFRIDEANIRNPNGDGRPYIRVTPQGRFIDENGNALKEGIEATNPCGEQPLPPYGSCNLGSINLANFVLNPYTEQAGVDWDRLGQISQDAVRFLDNIIDVNKYPLPEIKLKATSDRRIGVGVMGWAEMLVQLGLPYDSKAACRMGGIVMSHIKQFGLKASMALAVARGTYPEWEGSLWAHSDIRVRNATITTVAPTGTISLLAATPKMPCSGGIEPKFALAFTRNQAGMQMDDVDGQFAQVALKMGWYSKTLLEQVAECGSLRRWAEKHPQEANTIPDKWLKVFACAEDIAPEWHVKMQEAFQGTRMDGIHQPIDAACSKTINFPSSATYEDIDTAYSMAFTSGLKGITVYRDNSRANQVLTSGNAAVSPEPKVESWSDLKPRPEYAAGKMFVVKTHFGNMTIDIHEDPESTNPFEFIVNVGAAGSDLMADAVGIGMLGSLILRMDSRIDPERRIELIVDKIKNIGTSQSYGFGPNRVTSLASAVALGLQRYLDLRNDKSKLSTKEQVHVLNTGPEQIDHAEMCPECKNYTFVKAECQCKHCGYSACK